MTMLPTYSRIHQSVILITKGAETDLIEKPPLEKSERDGDEAILILMLMWGNYKMRRILVERNQSPISPEVKNTSLATSGEVCRRRYLPRDLPLPSLSRWRVRLRLRTTSDELQPRGSNW